jgi:hypothetical protein
MAHNAQLEAGAETSEQKASSASTNTLSAASLDLLKEPRAVSARSERSGPDSLYPDLSITPGATFPDVTAEQVCQPGYSKGVRNVSAAEKAEVFKEYGVTPQRGQYEVDHLISLELGGSNDISNLWPEPYEPRPGAHEKDAVENYLHKQVCDGSMSLDEAQKEISTDWYKVYQQIHGGDGN